MQLNSITTVSHFYLAAISRCFLFLFVGSSLFIQITKFQFFPSRNWKRTKREFLSFHPESLLSEKNPSKRAYVQVHEKTPGPINTSSIFVSEKLRKNWKYSKMLEEKKTKLIIAGRFYRETIKFGGRRRLIPSKHNKHRKIFFVILRKKIFSWNSRVFARLSIQMCIFLPKVCKMCI